MEYSFSRNDIGQPVAELNMEAEAFAHWLNIEMSTANFVELSKISEAIEQLFNAQIWQFECTGREFHLELNREQACVSANAVLQQNDDFELSGEDEFDSEIEEYEQELAVTSSGLVASCGLEDFQQLLLAWIRFLQSEL